MRIWQKQFKLYFSCWLQIEIQTALIRGVVKFNAASDRLPYLCPTRFLGLATSLHLALRPNHDITVNLVSGH